MYQILDGKELARKTREELRIKADRLRANGIVPKLAVILVGDDSASRYMLGIRARLAKMLEWNLKKFC